MWRQWSHSYLIGSSRTLVPPASTTHRASVFSVARQPLLDALRHMGARVYVIISQCHTQKRFMDNEGYIISKRMYWWYLDGHLRLTVGFYIFLFSCRAFDLLVNYKPHLLPVGGMHGRTSPRQQGYRLLGTSRPGHTHRTQSWEEFDNEIGSLHALAWLIMRSASVQVSERSYSNVCWSLEAYLQIPHTSSPSFQVHSATACQCFSFIWNAMVRNAKKSFLFNLQTRHETNLRPNGFSRMVMLPPNLQRPVLSTFY